MKYKSETDILRECCEYLAENNLLFWRTNNLAVFGRSLPKYTPKGLPDINVIIYGKYIGIEVKRPAGNEEREANGRKVRAGELSPQQLQWGMRLSKHGATYEIVRSRDELVAVIQRFV